MENRRDWWLSKGTGSNEMGNKVKKYTLPVIKTLSQVDIMYNMTVVNNTVLHISKCLSRY